MGAKMGEDNRIRPMESSSSIEIKKFLVCEDYKNKELYKEIERDHSVILSNRPKATQIGKKNEFHLIIVTNNNDNYYSIYQTTKKAKAKEFFGYFAPILNPILKCRFSIQSLTKLLQKITKFSRLIKENHWTLLHVYANFNLFEILDLIKQTKQTNDIVHKCQNDISINLNRQTKSKKFTALHLAIRKRNYKFAEKLLNLQRESIDFRLVDSRGSNVFHFAILAENKNKDFLKLLLNNCTDKNHLIDALKAKNCRQCTALHLACYSHSLDCIKLILKIPLPIDCFVITNDQFGPGSMDEYRIQEQDKFETQTNLNTIDRSLADSTSMDKEDETMISTITSKATNTTMDSVNADQVSSPTTASTTSTIIDKDATQSSSILASMESRPDTCSSSYFRTPTKSEQSDLMARQMNLIHFSKQQINAFVENQEEIFKGGTPLHWCNDKRYIGELLQMGFIKYVNVRNINQETALHCAVKRNSFRFIVILFCSGEKIDQTGDSLGNTPLHLAITYGNLNLVKLLTVFGDEENLNRKNKLGLTPRHLAAQNPSKAHGQILYALHVLGAKRCDSSRDNKKPSSNVKTDSSSDRSLDLNQTNQNMSQIIQCTKGCAKKGNYNGINIYNFEQFHEECWLSNFITKRISQNFKYQQTIRKKKTSKFNIFASKDRLARDTKSKSKIINSCLSLIKIKSKDINNLKKNNKMVNNKRPELNSLMKQTVTKQKQIKNRVLCIDGGGVKGVFAIQILIELEKRLKHPLSSYFNWFAGTSTGSFISTLMSLNYRLTDIRTLYFMIKNKVFQNYLPYDEEILEGYLKKYLGERTMCSIPNCKLTITSTLYDRLPVQLHLFRNYPSPNELLNKPLPKARLDNKDKTYRYLPTYKEQIVWKACRASSAAPIYFNSFGSFCDGGLISNSPVIDVIGEHFIYNELYEELNDVKNQKQEVEFIVSIGCGQNSVNLNEYEYDFSSFPRVDRFLKYVINAKPFSLILISELNNTEQHKQLRTMAWCRSMNIPYIRLSPFLSDRVKLDERNDEILVDGLWKCKAYFNQKKELIDEFVEFLESVYDKPPGERLKTPKFDINYKIDFDDTKLMPKEIKQQIEFNEQLYNDVKNVNNTLPYDM